MIAKLDNADASHLEILFLKAQLAEQQMYVARGAVQLEIAKLCEKHGITSEYQIEVPGGAITRRAEISPMGVAPALVR